MEPSKSLLCGANFGTITYQQGSGSMNFRLAGIDPTSVRFGCTGWRTVRSSWALYSSEKPLIDPESCEMTVISTRVYCGVRT